MNARPSAPSSGFGRAAEDRRRTIFPLIHQAACEFGLPVGLFDAMIMQESRYQPAAVSPKGALGLAQLMPGTARQLGVDPYSLRDNIRGAAPHYLPASAGDFQATPVRPLLTSMSVSHLRAWHRTRTDRLLRRRLFAPAEHPAQLPGNRASLYLKPPLRS